MKEEVGRTRFLFMKSTVKVKKKSKKGNSKDSSRNRRSTVCGYKLTPTIKPIYHSDLYNIKGFTVTPRKLLYPPICVPNAQEAV